MNRIVSRFRDIKQLPSWIYFFVAIFLKISKKILMRTKIVDPYGCLKIENVPCITVTWHNRLLYFPAIFPKKYRVLTYALISPSRDGQYVSDLVRHFGVRSVRGSTYKKGVRALMQAERVITEEKCNLSVTPDGPRGPKYKMSQGPIILASRTGRPILPLAVNSSRYWEFNSWDKFQVAKPGAKMELVFGNFINIPPNLTSEEIEKWRVFTEEKLMEITHDKER